MKNCIIYLAGDEENNYKDLNKSLELIKKNLLPNTKADVIIFHEKSFQKSLVKVKDLQIIYKEIFFSIPNYPLYIKNKIKPFFPHPTHGNGPVAWGHPGFSIGYRHMCRFFSGTMYFEEILFKYEYYLRLDSDSFILSKIKFDIFEFMKKTDGGGHVYGYIKPAVQFDNVKVIEGLWEFCGNPRNIPKGLMYYTNFEIGKFTFFRGEEYKNFFDKIDKSGGIYIHRWGDAPIKYIGVNLFANKSKIIPINGFIYQHGAIYDLRKKYIIIEFIKKFFMLSKLQSFLKKIKTIFSF
jgi:Glycolipid 2-alpha-mannosyltransferase